MTLAQVLGSLLIFTLCPLLGALPLIDWIARPLTGKKLAQLGTGNLSVSAAFYHGGRLVGILAVLSEALKGIAAVLLARQFFAGQPEWEMIALIALVMGRYWAGKGAGTTNVVWGIVVHDWLVAVLVLIIGGISFTIFRERKQGRTGIIILLPTIVLLLHSHQGARIVVTIALSSLLFWIYRQMPDDLDLPTEGGKPETRALFHFFRADKALVSLDKSLDAAQVGQKAATLSQLKGWDYPVPKGWVLLPGDDPEPLLESLQPSEDCPLAVRSSAIGEDSEQASAAGQYESVLNVTSREALERAIERCLASYDRTGAIQYRRDRGLEEDAMAVLVQHQVRGVFSGVAFSRDPISRSGEAVAIEALPGEATRVVSGQVTPERYRVWVPDEAIDMTASVPGMGEPPPLEIEGEAGDLPPTLLRQVAWLARHLEARYQQVPQDIEWSYDGQNLWVLQCRPITTLLPIWTRKIAAEVIPGAIHPLTWSIDRPLTCGVWGDIFTIVLGDRAQDLDFKETATLQYSHAYFNASLLGQIFLRMGLPPESLEFLMRGSSLSKPPLTSTLRNLPGLLRLLGHDLRLERDFRRHYRQSFSPLLDRLNRQPACTISTDKIEPLQSAPELLQRIDDILESLRLSTYYNILIPLGLAARKAIFKVKDRDIDNSTMPEVAVMRSLGELAIATRYLLPGLDAKTPVEEERDTASLFVQLSEMADGETILTQLDRLLERYGYLSEVGTDIAVPTWKENPHPLRNAFAQLVWNPLPETTPPQKQDWKAKQVQKFTNLKGQVTSVYSQLLAELRWSFIALEKIALDRGLLERSGDIFFLLFDEIRTVFVQDDRPLIESLPTLVKQRRSQLKDDRQLSQVPPVIYGNAPPHRPQWTSQRPPQNTLQGIGASSGQAQGWVKVLRSLQGVASIDRNTILVVPYTDSGWAPLLAQAGGLIAEVGGRLSHGAIVAREYGIPAVMDLDRATTRLRDGQRVHIDGDRGIVEILE